jgi:hypothetical protein
VIHCNDFVVVVLLFVVRLRIGEKILFSMWVLSRLYVPLRSFLIAVPALLLRILESIFGEQVESVSKAPHLENTTILLAIIANHEIIVLEIVFRNVIVISVVKFACVYFLVGYDQEKRIFKDSIHASRFPR